MTIGSNTAAELKRIVERVESLEEQKRAIADDIKEVYADAKATGFDTKALRKVMALRRMDSSARTELQSLIDTYMHALGMDADEEESLV